MNLLLFTIAALGLLACGKPTNANPPVPVDDPTPTPIPNPPTRAGIEQLFYAQQPDGRFRYLSNEEFEGDQAIIRGKNNNRYSICANLALMPDHTYTLEVVAMLSHYLVQCDRGQVGADSKIAKGTWTRSADQHHIFLKTKGASEVEPLAVIKLHEGGQPVVELGFWSSFHILPAFPGHPKFVDDYIDLKEMSMSLSVVTTKDDIRRE